MAMSRVVARADIPARLKTGFSGEEVAFIYDEVRKLIGGWIDDLGSAGSRDATLRAEVFVQAAGLIGAVAFLHRDATEALCDGEAMITTVLGRIAKKGDILGV